MLHADQIGGLEHLALVRRGDVEPEQPRMRDRAAHERDLHHADQLDVADEPAAPAHQPVVLQPRQRRPDPVLGLRLRGHVYARPALNRHG